jgi:topoisomerase IA-like protein
MAFSIKKLQAYVKSPQGKKLIDQAKKLDTPQNREKAKELFADLRKKAGPAAKSAAQKAGPAAKSAAKKVTERKKPNPPGGVAPPP